MGVRPNATDVPTALCKMQMRLAVMHAQPNMLASTDFAVCVTMESSPPQINQFANTVLSGKPEFRENAVAAGLGPSPMWRSTHAQTVLWGTLARMALVVMCAGQASSQTQVSQLVKDALRPSLGRQALANSATELAAALS